jgi:hypothetical protein
LGFAALYPIYRFGFPLAFNLETGAQAGSFEGMLR